MKIDRIAVQNYRTLENIDIEFKGYYTAISGQNNAGKTTLIKVLRETFKDNLKDRYYFIRDEELSYQEDKTQWVSGTPDIIFDYLVTIEKDSDPGLFQFIEKFYEKPIPESKIALQIKVSRNAKDEVACACKVNGTDLSDFASKEILQKLKSSNLAFVHDSAARDSAFFFGRGRFLHELIFSPAERKKLSDEQKRLQNKVKSISRAHKTELSELLGHLEDKFEVEFTIPDGMFTGLPFSINLKDKNVDVPLDDWGSGTKNRTHIMMSILTAHRIQSKDDQSRITPLVMIEEPESFLHPSAQAEFGRVLRMLANDLKIQTIVTTHSPYMLSQENVTSNILLVRDQQRGKLKATKLADLQENTWMEPFSVILGLNNSEFKAWREVIGSDKNCVLLVEGEIDRQYLEHIHSLNLNSLQLPEGLEIVPYEGKDALKNTILLKFIVEKFKHVFITFDLDAKPDLDKIMKQIGLKEGEDYLPIGIDKPGKQCIEGLVPERILSKVHSENTDLVMQLGAQDPKQRKSAKNALKRKILSAFQVEKNITEDELKLFKNLFKSLSSLITKNSKIILTCNDSGRKGLVC
ncbi:MAG: ATP-binding protein [Desulfobacula sp.]|nr:ATP-binding protein [Desulfobacula sp.]